MDQVNLQCKYISVGRNSSWLSSLMAKGIRIWSKYEPRVSCCQIHAFRFVRVILASEASSQDLIVAGCPFRDNEIELIGACVAHVEFQLKCWLAR